jgi:zinc and cadmium transporter
VPHRVGDFAVLLHAGYTATSALRMAVLPSLGALLGVALVAAFGASGGTAVYWLLPISAASFLYIACVNLLPELRHQHGRLALALQMLCLFGGAALVALVAGLPGA